MSKKYGFIVEEYETGKIETLVTGDGKTQFSEISFDDGSVGIGMSYGRGGGIGVKEVFEPGTISTDIGVQWQVKFDNQLSVDSMIETLLRVKNALASKQNTQG